MDRLLLGIMLVIQFIGHVICFVGGVLGLWLLVSVLNVIVVNIEPSLDVFSWNLFAVFM